MSNTVAAKMNFLSASYAGEPVRHLDQRAPAGVATTFAVMNAHEHTDPRLHATGFELVNSPSAVTDFYDCDLVIGTYYNECKAIAKKLTGAHATFTHDHIWHRGTLAALGQVRHSHHHVWRHKTPNG